ncbi:MAG: hypothetical protein HXY38_13140 [Chloroflexi bacterium]|nr:hypothetical protein [Chloroflexota bacterium]
MKKGFMTIAILLALLASTVGTALAGSALELVEVRNDDGVPTFVFRVTGEFSKSDLESGFVQVDGGGAYPLYCAQVDAETVVCHTSQKVAGQNVVVGFGGMRAWVRVPEKAANSQYCYNVYDWNNVGMLADGWASYGVYCQDEPANIGDSIYFDTGFFSPDTYFFLTGSGGACGWADPGEGYYYPDCPGS